MDAPDADVAELDRGLAFIRTVNRRLGGTRAVLAHMEPWLAAWPASQPLTVLDVATGSADIPLALAYRAKSLGRKARIMALDMHATTLQFARRHIGHDHPIQLLRGDATRLPLADNSVDFVISSLFFHHLTTPQATGALKEMVRVVRHGLIVSDLVRSRWAMAAIKMLTLFSPRLHRHDARVSVAKGWHKDEVLSMAASAGASYARYQPRLFARFTLAGLAAPIGGN